MKPRQPNPFSFAALAAAISAFACLNEVHATIYTWDGGPGASTTDDTVTGGDGTWSTGGTNWDDGTVNSVNGIWADLYDAIFGGTAGTVSLASGGVSVHHLTFNSVYTIQSDTLILGGTAPTITTNANATISSTVSGSAGLTKTGASKLTLSGANSYTGATVINGGVLEVTGSNGALPSTTAVSLSNGGSLKLSGGAVSVNALTWVPNSAVASSTYAGGYAANMAIDDNSSTYWASGNGVPMPQSIYADLGTVTELNKVEGTWFAAGYSPGQMKLQVSNDAVTWTDASATVSGGADSTSTLFNSGIPTRRDRSDYLGRRSALAQ